MPEETKDGTYYVDANHPLQYVLLNPAQIEQVRAIVREEIAEALKLLLNEPSREVVIYPSEYTYKQDDIE